MHGVDRKICHEGHLSALRGLPRLSSDSSCKCIPFDLPHLIFKEELAIKLYFSVKEFLLKFDLDCRVGEKNAGF